MPRKARETSSRFGQLQKLAQRLLTNLRIRSKENELRRLRDEESKLFGLTGLPATSGAGAIASRAVSGGSARTNWAAILEQLPKQFRADDVRKVGGLDEKRDSEIFAGISRWIDAGTAKRKERGLYERMEQSKSRKSNKTP